MSSLDSIVSRFPEGEAPQPYIESRSDQQNRDLRERSGSVEVKDDRLTSFLYDLMRDHIQPSAVEKLVRDADPNILYTNGWLASYAKDVADRLREK